MSAAVRWQWRQPSVLPGFGLAFGYTILYLSLIVLIPLSATFFKTFALTWAAFSSTVTAPRVLASLRLTFGASLVAALANGVFGLLVAWVLVRYRFPGRRIIDALVDLPFALPTAVAGIALTAIYAPNGPLGAFAAKFGIKTAYSPVGIFISQDMCQGLDRRCHVEEIARPDQNRQRLQPHIHVDVFGKVQRHRHELLVLIVFHLLQPGKGRLTNVAVRIRQEVI